MARGALATLVQSVVPAALVLASVVLLLLAAVSQVTNLYTEEQELLLFGAGGYAWLSGIAWGVLVNGRARRAPA